MSSHLLPHAYFNGAFVPFESATVSVATHALQYGTAVFGGIRGYRDSSAGQINIFRLDEHCRRFLRSAALLKIRLPFDAAGLQRIAVELTARNAPAGDVYLRPFAYKAGFDLTPTLEGVEDGFAMYQLALGDYYAPRGLSVCVSSWQRVSDLAIPARGKISGAYVNSALAKDDAAAQGFDEAILLNARGKVSEGSAANLFLVRDAVLVSPPTTADILEGITRRTVMELARALGLAVQEREIDRSELYAADELFFCGTGAQITPIVSVDRRPIGAGEPGPTTVRLRQWFLQIVRGEVADYRHWLTPVHVGVASPSPG